MIAEHVTVPSPAYDDGQVQCWVGDALEVLQTMPAHSVHCVITSPPYWGLRGYGVGGQLGLEATPEEFVEYCKGRIARHKIPRHWEFVESYPMTASGKIQKFKLRDFYSKKYPAQ